MQGVGVVWWVKGKRKRERAGVLKRERWVEILRY